MSQDKAGRGSLHPSSVVRAGHYDLRRYRDADAAGEAAAQEWLAQVQIANQNRIHQLVALSGGRTAKTFFAAMAQAARAQGVPLDRVHFFWADERCVPPDDPESNFRLAREFLLAPLGVSDTAIHRIRGELGGEEAARRAEAELRDAAPPGDAGVPVLDLVFLGMGEDGHVASLFPGEPEELASGESVYRAVTAYKPPPHRVTLGYGAIEAARQVWVLASGDGKEPALSESVSPAGRTPLARVLRSRATTRIYTDLTRR